MEYRPKIKLTQDEFRVLASGTRIDILKLLDESQFTVSDVSRRLGMNKATVHEHLAKLMEVGLVKKEESPRKWVYYKLTWKGRNLLHPERVKVMVSLAITLTVIVVATLLVAYSTPLLTPDEDAGNGSLNDVGQTPTAHIHWGEGDAEAGVYDIVFESTSTFLTMTEVRSLGFYVEEGPTTITRSEPIQMSWYREGDVIHIRDFERVLEDHQGKYLYVEGTVMDDRAIERTFKLHRYIVPEGVVIDLRISALGVVINTTNITTTGLVGISFQVENRGTVDVMATPVEVFSIKPTFRAPGFPPYGSPYLHELFNTTLDIATNGTSNVSFEVSVRDLFLRGVMVVIDPENNRPEAQEKAEDNTATMELPQEVVDANRDADTGEDGGRKETGTHIPGFGSAMAALAAASCAAALSTRRRRA